ncbi:MAG: phage portal protein [Christensenellales bacterium]|jgi:HK97 family phage portal protein
MGLISWLASKIFGAETIPLDGTGWADDPRLESLMRETVIRELAFETAANMIANSISKCEFLTYIRNDEEKGAEWYLWNVEPNRNQNSSAFIHQWINTLLRKNECLIVEANKQLLVADSFKRVPYALYDDIFEKVQVGSFTFDRSFYGNEVLYFRLNSKNMKKITDSMFDSYSRLISYAMKAYQQSRGRRGVLKSDAVFAGDETRRKQVENMIQGWFKTYFEADNAVLPLPNGYEYKENDAKTYSAESTRDIRSLVDDVFDFTANGFGIPPTLIRGNVAGIKDALDMYLTFCIDPLADQLMEEINRKRIGMQGVTSGTRIVIDTSAIKHIDLMNVAPNVDKLIASGVQTVNDILRMLNKPPIDEEWANTHFMTKNYDTAQRVLEGAEAEEQTQGYPLERREYFT